MSLVYITERRKTQKTTAASPKILKCRLTQYLKNIMSYILSQRLQVILDLTTFSINSWLCQWTSPICKEQNSSASTCSHQGIENRKWWRTKISKISDMLHSNFQNSKSQKSQHSNQVSKFHKRIYKAQTSKTVWSFLKSEFETQPWDKMVLRHLHFSITLFNSLKCSHLFRSETSDHSRQWPFGQRKHYKLPWWADSKCQALSSFASTITVGDATEEDPLKKVVNGRKKK